LLGASDAPKKGTIFVTRGKVSAVSWWWKILGGAALAAAAVWVVVNVSDPEHVPYDERPAKAELERAHQRDEQFRAVFGHDAGGADLLAADQR
jgi:hypothetical protein